MRILFMAVTRPSTPVHTPLCCVRWQGHGKIPRLGKVDNPCPLGRPKPHGLKRDRGLNPFWLTGHHLFDLYPPEGTHRPHHDQRVAAPEGYVASAGACARGLSNSTPAQAARSMDECVRACTGHASCVSVAWQTKGPVVFHEVRSQCWLSSTCLVPDCCATSFETLTRRGALEAAAGALR